jgi:hypothetical protein
METVSLHFWSIKIKRSPLIYFWWEGQSIINPECTEILATEAKFHDTVWPQRSWYTELLGRNRRKRQIWRKDERNIFCSFCSKSSSFSAWLHTPLLVPRLILLPLHLTLSFKRILIISLRPIARRKMVRIDLMTSYIYSTSCELVCIMGGLTAFTKKQTFGVREPERTSQFHGMTKSSKGSFLSFNIIRRWHTRAHVRSKEELF